jgi:hypothetical protein
MSPRLFTLGREGVMLVVYEVLCPLCGRNSLIVCGRGTALEEWARQLPRNPRERSAEGIGLGGSCWMGRNWDTSWPRLKDRGASEVRALRQRGRQHSLVVVREIAT